MPRNYEELKEDDDFNVLVQQNAHMIDKTLGFNENILDDIILLIEELEHEIERLGG